MTKFKNYFLFVVLPLILIFGSITSSVAQITISPTFVFMDDQNRFGTMLVMNGSQQAQEVSIEYVFGYPDAGENGNIYMNYDDSTAADRYSIAEWIRGFPQNFTLQPGQRQVVRFIIRPPADLENGVYWTRIRTSATPLSPPIGDTSQDNVAAQISISLKQVTTALYKHGNVSTGLNIENLSINLNENDSALQFNLEKTGEAPFLGSQIIEITNSNGESVYYDRSTVSIFFDMNRKISLDTSNLSPGNYQVKLSYLTQRSDIAEDKLYKAQTVTQTSSFTIR